MRFFGRKATSDQQLRANHAEYFKNCMIQIGELDGQIGEVPFSRIAASFADVWDQAPADEIVQKVVLAKRYAADLEPKLCRTEIQTAGKALELLQEIIDGAQKDLESMTSGLVMKQMFRASEK